MRADRERARDGGNALEPPRGRRHEKVVQGTRTLWWGDSGHAGATVTQSGRETRWSGFQPWLVELVTAGAIVDKLTPRKISSS